jgi:hypothetical protein
MKNKMPKLDMGGLYMGAAMSRDVENQPVSGYGTSDADKCPPNCGPGSGAKHAKQVRKTQQKRTQTARKNVGKCGRK